MPRSGLRPPTKTRRNPDQTCLVISSFAVAGVHQQADTRRPSSQVLYVVSPARQRLYDLAPKSVASEEVLWCDFWRPSSHVSTAPDCSDWLPRRYCSGRLTMWYYATGARHRSPIGTRERRRDRERARNESRPFWPATRSTALL